MKSSRLVFIMFLALLGAGITVTNVSAQTYKRHALIEEGTGTWCQWCAWGGYDMNAAETAMGKNLVAISWHGPKNYGEPMYLAACDTFQSQVGATGYPFASVGRRTAFSGAPVPVGLNNEWYMTANADANTAPILDFRIVNAYFHSNSVDFDVDITPFNVATMPREDTVNYVLVTAITEDGIVSAQEQADLNGGSPTSVDNYVHHNVARAVGGKVLGDVFVLGTKTATMWPVRKHVHFITNKADWVQDSIRIKAFVAVQSKKSGAEMYLDADQSGYVTKLPTAIPKAVWVVLPRKKDDIPGDSAHFPIVWNRGGGAATTVKLDFSIDGGTTWINSATGITTTTYEWKVPDTAYGQQVMVRLTDAADGSVTTTTGSFSIEPKPAFVVNSPKAADIVYVGSTVPVDFTPTGGAGENVTIEVSRDSLATWTKLGTVSGGASTYSWKVAGAATTQGSAFIRVSDGLGAIGLSGAFSIYDSGTINAITVDGGPNLNVGAATTIHWAAAGYLGETINVDASYDGQQSWSAVTHALSSSATSTPWTVPAIAQGKTAVIRVMGTSGAQGFSSPLSIGSASVAEGDAPSEMRLSPNPFSYRSIISYSLTETSTVTFIVHDLLGREVARTGLGTTGAGPHTLNFDGSMLPAGSYEYILLAGKKSYQGKMSIVR